MADSFDSINPPSSTDMGPPPPPPPPPPPAAPSRRHLIGRKGAAMAVASGLVVGGVAGGYVISQAATSTPSATATPTPAGPHGFGGGDPAARTDDMQQVAAAIGISSTQLQTEMSAGKTIAAVAKEHNVDPAKVISALATEENADLDAAVSAGTVTSAQAAQMKTETTQRVTEMVNGTRPAHGPGGPGGPGGAGGMQGEDQQVIAAAIGISSAQLQTELDAGKTIAAIAKEHNVTAATVISALTTSENSEIDKRVAGGQITSAQATQEKSQTQQRVTDEVNGTRPAGGPWGPHGDRPEAPQGSSSTN